MLSNIQH